MCVCECVCCVCSVASRRGSFFLTLVLFSVHHGRVGLHRHTCRRELHCCRRTRNTNLKNINLYFFFFFLNVLFDVRARGWRNTPARVFEVKTLNLEFECFPPTAVLNVHTHFPLYRTQPRPRADTRWIS